MNAVRAALLLAAAVLALGAMKAGPETELEAAVGAAFRAAKRTAPKSDKALAAAASALARVVLAEGAKAATDSEAVANELSRAGAWDPPPRVLAVRASPPEHALRAMSARADLAALDASHLGAGFASDGASGVAVLLFTERRAFLEPFPRAVSVGFRATLKGDVVFPLYDARVLVTGPKGAVRPEPVQTEVRHRFEALLSFPAAGVYTIEVEAQSAKGPQVAALFRVQAGEPGEARAPASETAEVADLAKAEAQVLSALNARRKAAGLKPLSRSSLLDSMAGEHSSEMARLGYFAHVSPVAGDVTQRARQAGFRFRRIAENLGEAASALEAHRTIEASPGHLANVLDPDVDLVGLGTARARRGSIDNVLLTEIFARAEP